MKNYPSKIYVVSLLLFMCGALFSCVTDEREVPAGRQTHTLLAYIGGDNNLSDIAKAKVDALTEGFEGKQGQRLIIYLDTYGADSRLLEVTRDRNGNLNLVTESFYFNENSASATVLSRVIDFVRTEYPSDSYGLLVFSHASGWLPEGTLYNPGKLNKTQTGAVAELSPGSSRGTNPGIRNSDLTESEKAVATTDPYLNSVGRSSPSASDGFSGSASTRSIIIDGTKEMDLKDFAGAIPDRMFDYIVFETCFMAGIEVAYELRNKTPLILASSAEIVHPGFGPVYPHSLGRIMAGDLSGFGQSVFGHVMTYAENNPQRSATYSVIDTSELDALAAFVKNNCDFSKEVPIDDVQHFDRLDGYRLFFDFEDYYGRLLDTDAQRAELRRLVASCVGWKASTDEFMTQSAGYNGFTINKHSGLTAYIHQEAFNGVNNAYLNLGWAKAVGQEHRDIR